MSQSQEQPAGGGQESGPVRWTKPGCVTIRCRENGPLVIELPGGSEEEGSGGAGPARPEVRVIDHEGSEFSLPPGKRPLALCRCGHSGRRPFCDGSHRETGFRAADRAD